jgi:transposase-like protein
VREAVLERYRVRYEGLGPTLCAEKLLEEGYAVDHETLRRWLIADGQWQRRRKRGKHRSRRERKARFGEMLQLDGSPHAWFGPEVPRACLMDLVDDATSACMALMAQEETTAAAMRVLWKWVERHGIPKALYLDRKSVYLALRPPTPQEQLAGEEPLTEFGKACNKLGIELITAYSPQAKGRVERKHGVYQDRFVHELRLQNITTIDAANALLDGGFTEQLNEKFAKPPREPNDAHRPVPRGLDLRNVFCFDESRTVTNDWCVQHKNRHYQILKLNTPLPKPKEKIVVRTWLDGSLHLVYKEHMLKYKALEAPPPRPAKTKPSKDSKPPAPKPKPKANHPWKKRAIPPARP